MNEIKKRYDSLDAVRAFAAIGIVMMHVLGHVPLKTSQNFITTSLIPFFCDFVMLFMIVSAFSLSCGYYERFKSGNISMNDFYKKRYTRILPFFAFLCVVDLLVSPSISSLYELFANITLCFGFLPNYGSITVIGVGWFLGIIFVFYMLYPFFVFLMDNKKRAWISFCVSTLLAIIALTYFESDKYGNVPIDRHNILVVAPFFLSGGLCYLYKESIIKFVCSQKVISGIIVSVISLMFFVFPLYKDGKVELLLTEVVLFSSWIVWTIGTTNKLLVNKVTKYLSSISMEIYLSHMMIYRAVEMVHIERYVKNGNMLYIIIVILVMGGAICFAHIMKFYILKKITSKLSSFK